MFWRVFTPSPDVGFYDVSSIQKWHLSVLLHPYLVSCVRCDHVQSCDVQSEFSSLGELAQAGTQAQKGVASDRGSEVRDRFANVVDSVFLHSKNVAVGGFPVRDSVGDQVIERLASVVGELLKERLRFGVGKRSHDGGLGLAFRMLWSRSANHAELLLKKF